MNLSIGEFMVQEIVQQRAADKGLPEPTITLAQLDEAIDTAESGHALGEYIGAAWDAAEEIVYEKFPEYREDA